MNCILVVGASSDFGLSLIDSIKGEYDLIYAHYLHHTEKIKELKRELKDKLVLIEDDLLSAECGKNIINTIKEVSILPNKIVYFPSYKIENNRFTKFSIEDFDNQYFLSVKACVKILQPLLNNILKQKLGCQVVVMLSSYTTNLPPKYLSPYICSKYALLGLVKSLAVEYEDKNITINGISPDMTNTKFLQNISGLIVEQQIMNSPKKRILEVNDVIPTIKFLLSDEAKNITGQNIVVS